MPSGAGVVIEMTNTLRNRAPVLVCTRLDDTDGQTVTQGLAWAELLGAPFVVCHVVAPLFGALAGIGDARRVIADYLERHLGAAKAARARIVIAEGDPEKAILQVARRLTPQLVVVGPSEEWSFWPRSRVTERITRSLGVSILVARGGNAGGPVVVGVNFTPDVPNALVAGAAEIARWLGGRIRAIHALDDDDVIERLHRLLSRGSSTVDNATRAEIYVRTQQLRRIVADFAGSSSCVMDGPAADGLIRACSLSRAALLVVGAASGPDGERIGTTASRTARRAPCSVLIARNELLSTFVGASSRSDVAA